MRARLPRYAAGVVALSLLATLVAAALAGSASSGTGRHHLRTWSVAPGVTYTEWTFTTRDGPQRVHVLDLDPAVRGVSLDYAAAPQLRVHEATSTLVGSERHAVAGVNGSFYDVDDTGAPLGAGLSRTRGLLHAGASGWDEAFFQAADGSYQVGPLALRASLVQQPTWRVSGLNSPHARPDSITVYTPAWGRASGRHVLDGRRTPVRQVHVVGGVVVQNTARLARGHRFHGLLLVGLGEGARELRSVAVGSRLRARWSLDRRVRMAITGSQVLVRDGRVVATDDHLLAPRTAVGIDGDTGHVVVATLDGRQPDAVGRTTRGWARVLVTLGVDDAVNLDGGRSSTMVARPVGGGAATVVNAPSLGRERWVPDALTVKYRRPRG
jgi:exopolysaccharide biosynthesis protein